MKPVQTITIYLPEYAMFLGQYYRSKLWWFAAFLKPILALCNIMSLLPLLSVVVQRFYNSKVKKLTCNIDSFIINLRSLFDFDIILQKSQPSKDQYDSNPHEVTP